MDTAYHHNPPDQQQPSVYNGDYLETAHTANRPPPSSAHEPPLPLPAASRVASLQGYDSFDFMPDFPTPSHGGGGGGGGFGGHRYTFPYGFDTSVPPPPFGCPPPGLFPNMLPPAPLNAYSSRAAYQPFSQQFGSGPATAQYDPYPTQRQPQHGRDGGFPPQCNVEDLEHSAHRAEGEAALQRKQDRQWLRRFLRGGDRASSTSPKPQQGTSLPELRVALDGAARLLSQLRDSCETLRSNVDNERVWMDSYSAAQEVRRELQDQLSALHSRHLDGCKDRLSRVAKRRAWLRRARRRRQMEENQREESISEKEAAIEKWRMEEIRRVEEKKTEQELKLAADAVLCEVRKKQADVKRMQDILRSLEKLRRLRKEAASRKGIVTESGCEEAFSSRLDQLRCVIKRRTAVYSAEENALMVMLEGEQEKERKREREKRLKKEKERLLQKKQKIDAMLFGDGLPVGSTLQPFREFHIQAESSLQALLQIRREWDVFVVPVDHPDGSPVPQGWVLPDAPSDQTWASALQSADTE